MSWLVIGGAGFIGSHLVDAVGGTVFDLREGNDARDLAQLVEVMPGHKRVALLASNPDLAAAAADPDVDFRDGTVIVRNVLEAMRETGVRRLVFASGSGVYGDQGTHLCTEDDLAMPVSPYGASKLAGEALIAAYAHLGLVDPLVLRLANVTGPRLTHGVVFDLVRKVRAGTAVLAVLGDGHQSKPYVHVSDVVAAMTADLSGTYNVSTDGGVTVTEIVAMVCAMHGQRAIEYTGGRGGWPGDVPVVRMDSSRLRGTGWTPRYTGREALQDAIRCA